MCKDEAFIFFNYEKEVRTLFRDAIKVVKEKDPAIKGTAEVLLYPSFWATIFHRVAHYCYRKKDTLLHV